MMDTFNNHLHLPVTKIDDSQRTLARLKARTSSHTLFLPHPEVCVCACKPLRSPAVHTSALEPMPWLASFRRLHDCMRPSPITTRCC